MISLQKGKVVPSRRRWWRLSETQLHLGLTCPGRSYKVVDEDAKGGGDGQGEVFTEAPSGEMICEYGFMAEHRSVRGGRVSGGGDERWGIVAVVIVCVTLLLRVDERA